MHSQKQSYVEFSILILNCGITWTSWNWRSRSWACPHVCM